MGHAKIMKFPLSGFSLGRTLVAGQVAPVPITLGALRFIGSALARFDANRIK